MENDKKIDIVNYTPPKIPVYSVSNNVYYENVYDAKNFLVVAKGDVLYYRYEIWNKIGRGVFGKVYKAKDHKYNEYVALKIIKNDPRYHKQAAIECSMFDIMYKNKGTYNSHIIKICKWFMYDNDVFLVFRLYGDNMYTHYKNNVLAAADVKNFSFQIADGLSFIHSHKIIHMDLKPENILISEKKIKIIDFGSSFIEKPGLFRSYVQSRYYRAPEVVFRLELTIAADIWSYGCIIYELLEGTPLIPAKTHEDLIIYYNYINGAPPTCIIDQVDTVKNESLSNGKDLPANTFSWKPENNAVKDLVVNCLLWDNNHRLTAVEIMKHDYFHT